MVLNKSEQFEVEKVRRKENIPIGKKENIPMRIRKIFQLEKGKYSNQKEINIPNRKRKSFQLEKGKYSN